MNGPHDLGGRGSFGAVAPDPDDPMFHADWERRVLGITLCCGALGHWTLDESRHARECLPPVTYHGVGYYRIWFEALIRLLERHGEITEDELETLQVRQAAVRPERRLAPDAVPAVLARGAPTSRTLDTAPQFAVGDTVRTVNDHAAGHTRLPGYARDKRGTIEAVHEPHVLPDTSAHGGGDCPQWLYTVRFEAQTLWGRAAEPNSVVTLEAWEGYLHGE